MGIQIGQHYHCEIDLRLGHDWTELFKGTVRVCYELGGYWVVENLRGPSIRFFVEDRHLSPLPDLPL